MRTPGRGGLTWVCSEGWSVTFRLRIIWPHIPVGDPIPGAEPEGEGVPPQGIVCPSLLSPDPTLHHE